MPKTKNLAEAGEIGILGAGAFGTALGSAFARSGRKVTLWTRKKEQAEEINATHKNSKYFLSATLPPSLVATHDFENFCDTSSLFVYACPSHSLRSIFSQIFEFKKDLMFDLINTAKGIDTEQLKTYDQVAAEIFGQDFVRNHFFCLSGPSFASEIVADIPTCVNLAGPSLEAAIRVRDQLGSPRFRPFASDDLIGCQVGGAVKNVIAIAVGMLEGMGLGLNTQAALINLGMFEIVQLGSAMGAKTQTLYGLAGLGDLILTCTGKLSRNRSFGILIGEGLSCAQASEKLGTTLEGVYAAKAVHRLATAKQLELPICTQIYQILHEGRNPKDALEILLSRPFR